METVIVVVLIASRVKVQIRALNASLLFSRLNQDFARAAERNVEHVLV